MGHRMATSMAVARKLINHVKQHPTLYDISDENYRNNEMKEKLWEKIASDLNENPIDVKRRWRNLRETYLKLLKLVKTSENNPLSYDAAIEKYKKWVWTKEMEFFRSSFRNGYFQNLELVEGSPQQYRDRESDRESIGSPTPLKKLKANTSFENSDDLETSTNTTLVNKLDATDRLFLAHAQTIKQFSARRQAMTKLKIAEVIMEQELLHQEDIENISVSSTTTSITTNEKKSKRQKQKDPFASVCD